MADSTSALLTLRDVDRSFGSRAVIREAQLSLRPGAIAWVGGANGAGKTTLLRLAAGLIAADRGDVRLLGLAPERDRREYQRRVGWLAAGNTGVYNRLTVRQNLGYWAAIALVPRPRRRAAIEAAIARFDLECLASERGDRISMGERQRLRLAMAFLHVPDLVLLDEPQTSLDDDALGRLAAALEALAQQGGSAVWCSPTRAGTRLPATEEYLVSDGRLAPC
jgi:ABC-2 type transport system ATP-binding protein